jgi:hypothetical protein
MNIPVNRACRYSIYLNYKERRQLKTFLTQFGPNIPLTSDPPVRLRDDIKGGTTLKITIWERFCQKSNSFLTTPTLPACVYPLGPLSTSSCAAHGHPRSERRRLPSPVDPAVSSLDLHEPQPQRLGAPGTRHVGYRRGEARAADRGF